MKMQLESSHEPAEGPCGSQAPERDEATLSWVLPTNGIIYSLISAILNLFYKRHKRLRQCRGMQAFFLGIIKI